MVAVQSRNHRHHLQVREKPVVLVVFRPRAAEVEVQFHISTCGRTALSGTNHLKEGPSVGH